MSAASYCGMTGRDNLFFSPGVPTVEDWLNEEESKRKTSFDCAKPGSLEHAMDQCPDGLMSKVEPSQILQAILAIETICRGSLDRWLESEAKEGEARVEIMIDEPGARYVICQSPKTPVCTAFFYAEVSDITVEEVVSALGDKRERQTWDADCEFDILLDARPDDPNHTEITFHTLRAPWPFWDRDVLQRRWRIPAPAEMQNSKSSASGASGSSVPRDGTAYLMQSVEDPSIYPRKDDRIRAIVHMSGQVIRSLPAEASVKGKGGIEITVCNKLDIGGIAPPWAQSMLCRFAAKRALDWAERLRQHCLSMREKRESRTAASVDDDLAPPPILRESELMGQ